MKYCTTCLYPETKPDLRFDHNGRCSACAAFLARKDIDWAQREEEFREICIKLITERHQYHCVVPVSGGKDSHYQILKCQEFGLRPLAVCAHTDHLSNLGRSNLDNIRSLGVDLVEVATSTILRRKLNAFTLREIGDISWTEHITIFSIPIRVAAHFGIPLVIWGENPQNEYGGPTNEAQTAVRLDKRWLSEFGGLLGLRVSDLIDAGVASKEELHLYSYPDTDNPVPTGLFLGQFFEWDGAANAITACRHGFRVNPFPVEGSGYTYENLDNLNTGIHDYFKWLKYGFGRATDLVSNHIRRGNLSREDGKQIILEHDGAYPLSYLGVSLEQILRPLGIDVKEFLNICNRFTNLSLFEIVPGRARPKPLFLEDLKDA